ncbi:hypothetical protein LTR36_002856 [Oleoguttula mirabilis]|uniref:RBR-type E3 ubiquitin transferase n=1 Tax=Oleoguttula mirabilis TaxID=1507867 RepID=A0AAV9JKH3_9PEZI|nr:hypothetical protein LTR36_002856 [Oleoguttula mirabilis]
MTSTPSNTFFCGFCLEDKQGGMKIGDDALCKDCHDAEVRPKFEAALENEAEYPVRWGATALEPHLMPTAFEAQWRAKCEEYRTPLAERVYCPHGSCQQYAGNKAELSDLEGRIVECKKCSGVFCGNCGVPLQPHRVHTCVIEDPRQEMDAFAGLVRGKDYQICPNPTCGIKVEIRDGCNAMCCQRCLTHFCYICGVMAHHNSKHWTSPSTCPRWNQPDASNAIHDRADDHGDNGAAEEAQRMEFRAMHIQQRQADEVLRGEQVVRQMALVLLPADSLEMRLVAQQQAEVRELVRNVYHLRATNGHRQAPEWTGWYITFGALLRRNLQWYAMDHAAMHWLTVRTEAIGHDTRHQHLLRILPRIAGGLEEHPRMRELFDEYVVRRN